MSFSLLDGFKSRSECHSAIRGDGMWCLFLIFASVFGAIKAFKLGNRILQFMDIKNFYHEALGISSGRFSFVLIDWYVNRYHSIAIDQSESSWKLYSERLDHLSWIQIQSKLLEAQKLNQMCIHKEELSELDVHNRKSSILYRYFGRTESYFRMVHMRHRLVRFLNIKTNIAKIS